MAVEEFMDDMEIVGASSTDMYKTYLITSLIELTQMSEGVMINMLKGRSDWEVVNSYISRLVHLLIHLYPKVSGGGSKTADLKKEFDSFKDWIYHPTIPIEDPEQGNRVPELLFLIRRAYERFNLTNF